MENHDPGKTQERSPVKIQHRDAGWKILSATFLSIWEMLDFLLLSVHHIEHKSEKQAPFGHAGTGVVASLCRLETVSSGTGQALTVWTADRTHF
jgi:hypothetical protein